MSARVRAAVALVLALVPGAASCRKYVTVPITRRPVISSAEAFPLYLKPGDSTLVTVFASDPDGDSLVYDWDASNGLVIKGAYGSGSLYGTRSHSQILYRSPGWPGTYDTAFVWCSVRDLRGGGDTRRVLIFYVD